MLRSSTTALVARAELWRGASATEPYEAGWASEAVVFIRALKAPTGDMPLARVEVSPDGMRWLAEGATVRLPDAADGMVIVRVAHFGNWLRVAADLPDGAEATVQVTMHLK